MSSKPQSFNDLDAEELYRSAIEDFALPVEEDEKNKKKVLLSAFVEGGVTWAAYVSQHPEVKSDAEIAEEELAAKLKAGEVVTSNAPSYNQIGEGVEEGIVTAHAPVEEDVEPTIHVAQPPVRSLTPTDKYLIRMDRDNPLFEVRGYKFTDAHPYQLMAPEDAQYVLQYEDGFRQATPMELQEFYG